MDLDKSTLKTALHIFQCFGAIKSRTMFGGHGIFANETMFALVVNGTLHLRASTENENTFKEHQLKPYAYSKKGHPVLTRYYGVTPDWWESDILIREARRALDIAKKEQTEREAAVPQRIKDLPNMRLTTERMLRKVGIHSADELKGIGAHCAFKALQENLVSPPPLELLWAIEGAITGIHASVIPMARRQELLANVQG